MSYIPVILENFLGEARKHREDTGQISFDCIECDNGRGRGNLEVNYHKGVFKCWSCKDINDMYGSLGKLVNKYGSKKDRESYRLIKPEYDYDGAKTLNKTRFVELPKNLKFVYGDTSKEAKSITKYLNNRGITDEMIKDFKIMWSDQTGYRGRVIIPSYDESNEIDYFIARAIYDIMDIKYNNPEADKTEFIFFESRINWNSDIYLVEGVFDSIVIPNSIPMLGKMMYDKLQTTLFEKAKANIIIVLDDDAYSDAEIIFNTLNILELEGRVKIIKIKEGFDPSLIFEKEGKRGIINLLSTSQYI